MVVHQLFEVVVQEGVLRLLEDVLCDYQMLYVLALNGPGFQVTYAMVRLFAYVLELVIRRFRLLS